jgi:hypothetical protein
VIFECDLDGAVVMQFPRNRRRWPLGLMRIRSLVLCAPSTARVADSIRAKWPHLKSDSVRPPRGEYKTPAPAPTAPCFTIPRIEPPHRIQPPHCREATESRSTTRGENPFQRLIGRRSGAPFETRSSNGDAGKDAARFECDLSRQLVLHVLH